MDDASGFATAYTDAAAAGVDDAGFTDNPGLAPVVFKLEPLRSIGLDRRPQWLIPGLMPSSGLHVLYGAPGSGKSFVGLHAALHVACGRRWAGREVRKGAVVYIAAEGGLNFRKRVLAAKTALDIPDTAPFALITQAPNLGGKGHSTEDLIADIRRQTRILGSTPSLIVLDTLARSITDLRESDAQDIMEFVTNAARISNAFDDALVMPIHHTGKDESKGMRGSSALHGAADAEWLVTRDFATGARHLSVEKMKDGPDGARIRFALRDHALGVDLAGAAMGTCVAEVFDAEAAPKVARQKSGPSQTDAVLFTLRALVAAEGKPAPEGSQVPEGRKVIPRDRLRKVFGEAYMPDAKPTAVTTAVGRAIDTLREARKADGDDRLWLVDEAAA